MMYIVFANHTEIQWHVGERLLAIADKVVLVQADGDELDYIKANFTGLTMTDSEVVVCYGDRAESIVGDIVVKTAFKRECYVQDSQDVLKG